MGHRLSAQFSLDSDNTGELSVRVDAGSFAGAGSAWFSASQLLEFADRLRNAYPLQSTTPIRLAGGYWSSESPPVLHQRHVVLEFYPIGRLGSVGCRVELATPSESSERAASRLEVELVSSYEQIKQFGQSLAAVARGQTAEAVLEAYVT